jgi:hypothetical protein
MRSARLLLPRLLLAGGFAIAGASFAQDDPCAAFSWNISHERGLFATSGQTLVAGNSAVSAPRVEAERLYELQLVPQTQVKFASPPGKSKSTPESTHNLYAGLAQVRVSQPGTYRISLDQPSWIDVLTDGKAIASSDFQGRSGCRSPHKIVQFALPAGKQLLLQFSGASSSPLRLTITHSGTSSVP